MLFLVRLLNQILVYTAQLPLQLIGMLVLLPLCLKYKIGELPRIFRWFDSADPFVGRNTETIQEINKQGYWIRYNWLAFRNPMNYFEYAVRGAYVKSSPIIFAQNREGYPKVGNLKGSVDGLYYTEVNYGEGNIYEYYYIYTYPFFTSKCFRFRMGHKIGYPETNVRGDLIQAVFVINPVASRS